jgi:hypothetical protein
VDADNPVPEWDNDGGSTCAVAVYRMIGTVNQIAWAVQIKSQVDAEFDRVRKVLEHAMKKQPPTDIADLESIIRILEEKRAEVMGNERAGYFIHTWQELRNQVSRMIVEDPKYQAIKASQAAKYGLPSPDTDDCDAKTPRQ